MQNQKNQSIHSRRVKNGGKIRQLYRQNIFQHNRKQAKEISYMKCYDEATQKAIKYSAECQIPTQLPPLSVITISLYRRANKPVFKTKASPQCEQFDPHMTYESLWMLAGIQSGSIINYQAVVKQFERDLLKYVESGFPEIKQMAVIAAGNNILGRKEDIKTIVDMDKKQLWVMINHIYDGNMSINNLFQYLTDTNQIIFRTIFQMSNYKGDQIIDALTNCEEALEKVVTALNNPNPEISRHALWILGNILAEKEEFAYVLQKYQLLNNLCALLNSNDPGLRKDSCWAISNFAFEKNPATDVVYNSKLFEKLLQLFLSEKSTQVKTQLGHIFSHLVIFADRKHIFMALNDESIFDRCCELLQQQDMQLNAVMLYFIDKLIQLGSYFTNDQMSDGDGKNPIAIQIEQSELKKIINKKTYAANKEISKLSSYIMDKLEDEQA